MLSRHFPHGEASKASRITASQGSHEIIFRPRGSWYVLHLLNILLICLIMIADEFRKEIRMLHFQHLRND